jgi:restriction endonuclease Mrr
MTKQKTAGEDTSEEGNPAPRGKKKTAKKPAPKKPAPKKPAAKKPAAKKPAAKPKKAAGKGRAEAARPIEEDQPAEIVEAARGEDIENAEVIETRVQPEIEPEPDDEVEAAPLSEEEQALTEIYGEDLVPAQAAHTEYQDRQTRDEDRPMLPEINAREERKQHWQDRRRERRERRDRERQERQDRRDRRDRDVPQAQPAAQQRLPLAAPAAQATPAAASTTNGHDSLARVGTPLGDAAASVFAQLRNGQPLPVRQLAAMMRKRNLVEADPEQLAPQLKAELLGDERSYRTLGLRPRIVYRGRDLFAPGPVAMSVTADAEAGVAASLSRLASATHRALAQRIAKASPAGFERLIHAYLVAAGYREIVWVKRVNGISYAQATAPGIERSVLISARSGDQPIDRRGVGELRVGVEAKNLVAGMLFSTRELSEDAERELERAGRSIAVICGDQLVAALIATGVGVVSAAAPLHYVDDQLLDELLAG